MPLPPAKVPASKVKSYGLTLGSPEAPWRYGVISYVKQARLPAGAVVQAVNCMQTQDGVWSNRWGSMNYGQALVGPITGANEFVVYNSDGSTTQYIGVIDNGTFKYSKDGGAWTSVATHTFSTTAWTQMLQYNTKILFCNGVDSFCYYDIKLGTIVTFTAISAPGTITFTATNLTTTGTQPYQLYYSATAVTQTGETAQSPILQIGVNNDRPNWYNPQQSQITPGTSTSIALAIPRVSGAIGYNVYLSDNISGVGYYLDSVPDPGSGATVTYTDYGNAQINDFQQAPTFDTTAAPKFSNLAVSDNRLWATGDPNNPQRVYYAAASPQYAQSFNPYVGGGYFDIEPGTNQKPRVVHQFRSGKGDPMTTILMAAPSGYGSTWNVSIGTDTIGNSVITIPNLIQSLGTYGSLSPLSVIETQQNVYFHSGILGFFSTGSMPTLFNVLATQEASVMIRPDCRNITLSALGGLCGIEYDRKLFYSVPYNNSTNNRIFVYDLEKNNWNPYAFDFGVKAFFRYTDNAGQLHLMAIPYNSTSLLEISQSFTTDNGNPIQCNLQSGLIHVDPSHVQWAHITYDFWEFDSPNGTLDMIFSGTPRNNPLEQINSESLTYGGAQNPLGYSSFQYSTRMYSSQPPSNVTNNSTTNEISVKHRQFVNKLVNNWEMNLITSGQFTLNTFSVSGQFIPVPPPSNWIEAS